MDEDKELEVSKPKKSFSERMTELREKTRPAIRTFTEEDDAKRDLVLNENLQEKELVEKFRKLKTVLREYEKNTEEIDDFGTAEFGLIDVGNGLELVSTQEHVLPAGHADNPDINPPIVQFILPSDERARVFLRHCPDGVEAYMSISGVMADKEFREYSEDFVKDNPKYSIMMGTEYILGKDGVIYKSLGYSGTDSGGRRIVVGEEGPGFKHIESQMNPEDYELCGGIIDSLTKKAKAKFDHDPANV